MANVKDWAEEAAREIIDSDLDEGLGSRYRANAVAEARDIRDIIVKHCPMKPEVAYMEVPRCATCKHWYKGLGQHHDIGQCLRPYDSDSKVWPDRNDLNTKASFGCVEWEKK